MTGSKKGRSPYLRSMTSSWHSTALHFLPLQSSGNSDLPGETNTEWGEQTRDAHSLTTSTLPFGGRNTPLMNLCTVMECTNVLLDTGYDGHLNA